MPPASQWELIREDRKSTRLNSSHLRISYAVFCLKKKQERGGRRAHRALGPAGAQRERRGAPAFARVAAGNLKESWRQQPGPPVYVKFFFLKDGPPPEFHSSPPRRSPF